MPIPLLERSDRDIAQRVKRTIEELELAEVKGCHQVTVRMTGKRLDISAHVFLDNSSTFEDAHRIVSLIERAIRSKVWKIARITIQTEPFGHSRRDVAELVAHVAEHVPGSRGVHNIHLQKINGKWCVDLHLEVSANVSVKAGYEIAKEIEKRVKGSDASISEVTVHVESASEVLSRELQGRGSELRWYIEHVAKRFPEIKSLHGIKIRRNRNAVSVVLRCGFAPGMSVKHADEISSKLESTIRGAYPIVNDVEIEEEPA